MDAYEQTRRTYERVGYCKALCATLTLIRSIPGVSFEAESAFAKGVMKLNAEFEPDRDERAEPPATQQDAFYCVPSAETTPGSSGAPELGLGPPAGEQPERPIEQREWYA